MVQVRDVAMTDAERSLKYVQGRMPEAESEAFELELLSNPALAKEVELDQHFKTGFAQFAAAGALVPHSQATAAKAWRYASVALAAGLLLGFALATVISAPPRPSSLSNLRFVMLDSARAMPGGVPSVNLNRVELPVGSEGLLIEVPSIGRQGAGASQVLFVQDPLGAQRSFSKLSPLDGYVSLLIPRSELRSGRYQINLEGSGKTFELDVKIL